MIIRPAIPSDAPGIAAIWNDVILNTSVTFTTETKTTEGLIEDIESRGHGFQVAEDQGQLIGFATYSAFRGGPGYAHTKEHSIQLAPEARGQGAGRALMSALEHAARQEGVHSLWAGVSGENPDGVAFHSAIGFEQVARLPQVGFKFGRWMDLVLMQKFLDLSR
ncbi:GNAT family N-acetyltransferase [Thalassococcus lentus]|uniref:GNAT family N-acetyltransferase n=1 Tax=Thalassococcus lentus TaxID=1210524 RepID=A0ABT4XVB0_9RHOB|nr:GNAT family N-acetyltransferase [Thalassococcus lentus]MDA7425894.1 GNAT family N-acetyltransferase [Thalassococcus lentus]